MVAVAQLVTFVLAQAAAAAVALVVVAEHLAAQQISFHTCWVGWAKAGFDPRSPSRRRLGQKWT